MVVYSHQVEYDATRKEADLVNTEALRKKISDSGVSITFIADKCGITRETLYNRFKGKGEFTVSEVVALTDLLHLSKEERDDIFLRRELN